MSFETDKKRHLDLYGTKHLKSAEAFYSGKKASKETILSLAQDRAVGSEEFKRKCDSQSDW